MFVSRMPWGLFPLLRTVRLVPTPTTKTVYHTGRGNPRNPRQPGQRVCGVQYVFSCDRRDGVTLHDVWGGGVGSGSLEALYCPVSMPYMVVDHRCVNRAQKTRGLLTVSLVSLGSILKKIGLDAGVDGR